MEETNTIDTLVVDDEEGVGKVTALMLNHFCGFASIYAKDAQSASEILKRHPSIRLALIDVNMPVVNGVECARQLRQINPGLTTIFYTGDDGESVFDVHKLNKNELVITKPFTGPVLRQRINDLLGGNFKKPA